MSGTPIVIGATVNLTLQNNVDWTNAFVVYQQFTTSTAPWANVAQWAPTQAYQSLYPATVVVNGGNLYVGNPATPQTWTSAATFLSEAANWVQIGVGGTYSATPVQFAGSKLYMRVVQLNTSGGIAIPVRQVMTLTSDGTDNNPISLTGDNLGNLTFNLKVGLTATVMPGSYGYDLIQISGSSTSLVMSGTLNVIQGASLP